MIIYLVTHLLVGYFFNRRFYLWWDCDSSDKKRRNFSIGAMIFGGWFFAFLICVSFFFELVVKTKEFKIKLKSIRKYHKDRKKDIENKYYTDWREKLKDYQKYTKDNNFL